MDFIPFITGVSRALEEDKLEKRKDQAGSSDPAPVITTRMPILPCSVFYSFPEQMYAIIEIIV